jgi:hypothetical protein
MSQQSKPIAAAAGTRAPAAGVISLITLVVIAVLSWLSLASFHPPAAVPASAAPGEFSSGRAMQHLASIAQRPHPIGSADQARVRDYLQAQLGALGMQTQIQRTSVVNDRWGVPLTAATVENVIGRLPGSAPGRSVVLMAHYDSVLAGPGANDDGASVAALLETVRALGGAQKNDVIVLFTDGEEAGLLGAKAFMDEHPLAKNVGLVLNFEARGSGGPSLMFETSPENGRLIQEFAGSARDAFASSLFYDVYRYLPNDTDFTMFKQAGIPGLNFAYIDGLTRYHSALDTVENVSEASLQHHGAYALALTRHFANLDLGAIKAPDYVYFDLLGTTLVRYPNWLVLPLAILAAALLAGAIALGLRRRHLTARGLLAGFAAVLLPLIAAVAIGMGLAALLPALHGEAAYYGEPYHRNLYLVGMVGLIVAATAALYAWLRRRVLPANLAVGALIWWLLLTILTSLALPGGAYLFTWPLIFSAIAMIVLFSGREPASPWRRAIVLLVSAIPAVVLFAPLVYLISVALTLQAGMIAGVITVLLLVLLAPHLELLAEPRTWLLPAGAALLGLGFIAAGALSAGASAANPRLSNVWYSLDADTRQAVWAGVDPLDDAWSQQFFSAQASLGRDEATAPLIPGEFRIAAAPAAQLAAPELSVVADTTSGDRRTLTLRATSPRQATFVAIFADKATPVLDATVDGKPAAGEDGRWALTYWALPAEGLEFTLTIKVGQPLKLRVIDRTDGLPSVGDATLAPRPADLLPAPSLGRARFGNATLVSRSFSY